MAGTGCSDSSVEARNASNSSSSNEGEDTFETMPPRDTQDSSGPRLEWTPSTEVLDAEARPSAGSEGEPASTEDVPQDQSGEEPREAEPVVDTFSPDEAEDTSQTEWEDTANPPDAVSVYEPPPEWWGDPIAAKPGEWTWVDFPNSRCADGTPTGLGINLSPGANRALIYFEGGGGCWNYATCFGIIQTSLHLSGYDEGTFFGLLAGVYKNSLLLSRDTEQNPLRDAHLVFLPYCTGDGFLGTQVKEMDGPLWATGEVHFWGRRNVEEYIQRLAPTFQNVDHLVIAGGSAGGFGAGFNWALFQEHFPGTRVDLLDDSGPPMNPNASRWEEWKEAWAPEFPDDCPECADSVEGLLNYFRESLLKNGKMGLMSYAQDAVISVFFGVLPSVFEEKLEELCTLLDEEADAHYFIVNGLLHTMTIFGTESVDAEDGTPLWWWITQMVDDDPNWKSHAP